MELDLYKILDKLAIAEMGKYKVENNQRKYHCPFHKEKTASFYVNGKFYHCFGCGKGGNAVNFLAELFNISNTEAYKRACEILGIALIKDNNYEVKAVTNPYEELSLPEKIIYTAVELEEPNEYLLSRGITELKVKKIYELKKDFRDNKSDFMLFKGCLVIPIYNNKGKVVNVQYITKNGTKRMLQGCEIKGNYLELIVDKDVKEVFLTEGVIDALSLTLAGFNAVFCVSCENLKAVALQNHEYFYKRGYVFADNDKVGLKAGEYATTILGTRYLYVDKEEDEKGDIKDANDYLKEKGIEGLKKKITLFLKDNIIYLFEYLIKERLLQVFYLKDINRYKVLFYKEEFLSESKNHISEFILNGMIKKRLIKKDTLETARKLKLLNHEIVSSATFVNNETYAPDHKYFSIVKKIIKNW